MTASISRVLFTERERFTNRMLAMGLPPSHLRESCYHIACTFEPKSQKTFNHLTHALTYLFLTLLRFHQHLSFLKLFPSFDSIPSCRKKYSGSETDTLTLTKNAEARPYALWDRSIFFASNSDILQVIHITIDFLSLASTSYMSEWPAVTLPQQVSPPDEENILARYHILDTSSTDGERIQKNFSTKSVISESGSYLLIDLVLVSFWWWEQRFLTWCSYITGGNHLPHVLKPLSQRSRSGQLWSGQL